jgi:hypothetical protein
VPTIQLQGQSLNQTNHGSDNYQSAAQKTFSPNLLKIKNKVPTFAVPKTAHQ